MSSRKSEISHFDELLLSKSDKISAKNVLKGYLSWHLRVMQKLKKLTCSYKYDMSNFKNFHPTPQKSENFTLMVLFCQKYIRFGLKNYRGVILDDVEQ